MVCRSVLAVVAALGLAGCPAGDDSATVDGAVDATHLAVTWAAEPAVPGQVGADRDVQELHIAYSSVRFIGDAAPGDYRTTRGPTELEWDDGRTPPPIDFLGAPPGLYSVLELGVGGGAESFSIEGQALVRGSWVHYEVEDEASNPSSLALSLDLRAGTTTTVPVAIDVAAVLAAVPFDDLPIEQGRIEVHRDDPEMAAVRAALAAAVHLAGPPEQ
ncbi:MAG TPA: hypothetical protein VHE35_30910 [Kofleriaceae bacterium]|nr:hypothetical protein [Kofleriaceae bacterium]